jgi:hypothetical protein
MKFAVTHYVVMIHKPGYGTYTPAFPNLDEAEEFSNAMRLMLDTAAISEPVPVVATESGVSSTLDCTTYDPFVGY